MQRDFGKLEEGPFDLLVMGGGIFGAWVAYDAALRGLKTALVEKKDWASGTSSVSSKLIHGGLRYLEHGWIGVVRKSLVERKRLLNLAPHRVFPVRFFIPIYEEGRFGRLSLGMGLSLYDRLAGSDIHIAPHQYHTRETLLKMAPHLSSEGLTGGFSYTDCQTDDARLTLEIVEGARQAGAVVMNYAEVKEVIRAGNRVTGAVTEDKETGQGVEIEAAVTVNAAGPWAWKLSGIEEKFIKKIRLTKGVHLVMPPLPGKEAVLLTAPEDGRVFFLIPWYDSTLVGTTDTNYEGDPGKVEVNASDEEYLLNSANRFLEQEAWTPADIRGRFAGIRVLPERPGKNPSQVTRKWTLLEPLKGLLMSTGGKLTSAREEAAVTVDRVMEISGKCWKGTSPTESRLFPWCPKNDENLEAEAKKAGLDPETAGICSQRYGSSLSELLLLLKESPQLAVRIDPQLPFCKGEIVHAAQNEMARTLEDILRRRIPLAILSKMEEETVLMAAQVAGGVLGWNQKRIGSEVRSVMGSRF